MTPFVYKVRQEPLKTCRTRSFAANYLVGYEVGSYGCPLKNLINNEKYKIVGNRRVIEVYDKKIGQKGLVKVGTLKVPVGSEVGHEVASLRELPVSLRGYAMPTPNIRSINNAANGALKRVLGKVGVPTARGLKKFRSFVRLLLRKNFEPLQPGMDMSCEKWLDMCNNYNEARKAELLKVASEFGFPELFKSSDRIVETHIKSESYPSYKYPRLINATQDKVKLGLGAASKYIESVVYANEGEVTIKFIKHVPMTQRIAYIQELMGYGCVKWFSTDYSSFECSFSTEFMGVCEQQLYKHMLAYYPDIYQRFKLMTGWNYCHTKSGVSIKIRARRMSGEMTTSLGNGFSNLALMAFIFNEHNLHVLGAVVEGDDGLGSTSQHIDFNKDAQVFGFKVKQLFSTVLGSSGFCGMSYDDYDQCLVVDPYERIMSLGWTASPTFMHAGPKKLEQALRAKALSLAYECPGCPILTELSDYILRCTRNVIPKFEYEYWQEQIFAGVQDRTRLSDQVLAARKGRTHRTRELFYELYGISPVQQMECERYLNELKGLQPLEGPIRVLFETCDRPDVNDWSLYYDMHIRNYRPGQSWN